MIALYACDSAASRGSDRIAPRISCSPAPRCLDSRATRLIATSFLHSLLGLARFSAFLASKILPCPPLKLYSSSAKSSLYLLLVPLPFSPVTFVILVYPLHFLCSILVRLSSLPLSLPLLRLFRPLFRDNSKPRILDQVPARSPARKLGA